MVILGSTGSIGESAIKVANDLSDRIEIIGIAAHKSAKKLLSQLNSTGARNVCLTQDEAAKYMRSKLPKDINFFSGDDRNSSEIPNNLKHRMSCKIIAL